ncbi:MULTISPECIES: hypothetical protein [Roseobacteraceae]|jgi:transposase|uniref:Transposase n=1 Tax=Pseudosulfitobacter pseudonitzschiae TaxID=1402135 RepID=A0A221K3M8_9RHOB|nr:MULTISPECIES: hypothetical protein [Roseobacteraceae]ASM73614.1 transposase [Pseudosulfitobacter pseudonitzschiae]
MNKKPGTSVDKRVKNIRRKTRQIYSAEEKIRIVLAGLRGGESITCAAMFNRVDNCQSLFAVRPSSLRFSVILNLTPFA